MIPAVYDQTSVDIEATAHGRRRVYGLRASGRILKFSGWLEAYGKKGELAQGRRAAGRRGRGRRRGKAEAKDAQGRQGPAGRGRRGDAARAREGEALHLVTPPGVVTEQKFTQPPPRYSEASLVRELEERGIGRPSTYAEIISKVQARDYVEKIDGGALPPTLLGKFVVDGLVEQRARLHGPRLHLQDGGGARRGRSRQGEARRLAEALLQALPRAARQEQEAASAGTRSPSPPSEKCELDGGVMLKRWSQERLVSRLRELPRVQEHARPRRRTARRRSRARRTSTATSAASPWSSGAGASASSSRAPATPRARTPGPCPSASSARSAAGDLIEIRPQEARRQDLLRLLELRGRVDQVRLQALAEARSPSRARAAARRSS